MERATALTVAGALALTAAGGASALFMTIDRGTPEAAPTTVAAVTPAAADSLVVTEYVDQFGNPVAAPTVEAGGGGLDLPRFVVVEEPAAAATPSAPTVRYVTAAAAPPAAVTSQPVAYDEAPEYAEAEEYEEAGEYAEAEEAGEHPEGEEHEDDEHEDDEHEDDEHEDDDD